ncbi:MAG: hypothetical protein IPL39_17250 [Opitutaceae bacterium]|nr:hypothetical protein [Opitutaceae bacterium]
MALYGQVLGHGFVALDDTLYVTACAEVREGLTWKGFLWAWGNFDAGNYHPLTWLSYMADVTVFGIEPGWMAFENVLIHGVNGWLVWRVLEALGCSRAGALMGAMAFVVHPLNVESVAWISQRKTVLAAAFGLAALLVYLTRVRRNEYPVNWQVVAFFAASLLAKPWFVVLPVLMLVLDVTCFGRLDGGAGPRGLQGIRVLATRMLPLLWEKVLLGVALIGAVAVALLSQKSVGAVMGLQQASALLRLENAAVSVVSYMADFFVPNALSVFYPLPTDYAGARVAGSALLLLLLTGVAWVGRQRFPEVTSGIVWFGLFLLPVIGLVQVGGQARADRYMYLPMIGLIWIAVRVGERALVRGGVGVRQALVVIAVVWLGLGGVVAQRQVMYWKNSFLLSVHSMKAVGPVPLLVSLLGGAYLEGGDSGLALPLFESLARRKNPDLGHVVAYARALHGVGRLREAIDVCRQVVKHDAGNYYAHAYLSVWLLEAGEAVQAAEHDEKMREIGPSHGQVPFGAEPGTAK